MNCSCTNQRTGYQCYEMTSRQNLKTKSLFTPAIIKANADADASFCMECSKHYMAAALSDNVALKFHTKCTIRKRCLSL